MHTFRPSRGRVFFDVFCALGIAACFVGGWVQTGASALLPAAAIAALYGFVRAFDLAARSPAFIAADGAPELKSPSGNQPGPADAIENKAPVEAEAAPARKARKTKAPRKASGRGKAVEKKVPEPVLSEEKNVTLVAALEEEGEFPEEVVQIPLTPLFEPEPFVRQQRAVFGRKAG